MEIPSEDTRRNSTAAALVFLLLLGALEYVFYFRDLRHFFQGDSLFLLFNHPTSLTELLKGFLKTDPSGRYRPLGNWLIPALFFSRFGVAPAGYRIVGFVIFFLMTIAVFALIKQLTNSLRATSVATFFFAIHTVNAYTTYDVAFITELMWALFYVCAAIAYLKRLETRRPVYMAISLFCFAASLCSKETAVTLPATLVALDLLTRGSGPLTSRIPKVLYRVRWHLLILLIYVVSVFGYMQVYQGAFGTLLKPPETVPDGGYYFILNKQVILKNFDQAVTWAFNIPRGWHTQWRNVWTPSLIFLRGFRLFMAALGLFVLFDKRRRWLIIGSAWFLLVLAPALPLRDHFIPYYLFLPLVGFSLAIGSCVDWLYQYLGRRSARTAAIVCFTPLAVLALICALSIRNDVAGNVLLGGSAQLAQNSLDDVHNLVPEMKPDTTLYLINDENADLFWVQAQGGLFKLFYKDALKNVLYSSQDDPLPPLNSATVIVLKYDKGHFRDVTAPLTANPQLFPAYVARYADGPQKISLQPAEVEAGTGSYVLKIDGLANRDVVIHYVLNQDPVRVFPAHLDAESQSHYDVSQDTPKGTYHFVGFNLPGQMQSIRSNATLLVR